MYKIMWGDKTEFIFMIVMIITTKTTTINIVLIKKMFLMNIGVMSDENQRLVVATSADI